MTTLQDPAAPLPAPPDRPARLFSARRLSLVLRFSSVQMLVQAAGFAAGIVLVRAMAQDAYGHYTLVVAMVGLCAVLLDLGLGNGLLALGGRHHDDPRRLGTLLQEAALLQRRLALAAGLPLHAGFVWMLHLQGLRAAEALGIGLLVALISWLHQRATLLMVVLRLQRRLSLQQALDLAVNLGRAVLLAGAALLHVDLWVATGALLVASAVHVALLKRRVLQPAGPGDIGARRALAGFVRRQAPNSVYYCLSAQITIWLVGWFGGAERVAEVGALGRLALLFSLIGAVLASIVQPYFARPRSAAELRQGFHVLNLGFAALTAALVAFAVALPQALLWVLGERYAGLRAEAPWMVAAGCLAAWSGAVYSMGSARGWIVPARWMIPTGVGAIVAGALCFDVATVLGAFQVNTLWSLASGMLAAAWVGRQLWRDSR